MLLIFAIGEDRVALLSVEKFVAGHVRSLGNRIRELAGRRCRVSGNMNAGVTRTVTPLLHDVYRVRVNIRTQRNATQDNAKRRTVPVLIFSLNYQESHGSPLTAAALATSRFLTEDEGEGGLRTSADSQSSFQG